MTFERTRDYELIRSIMSHRRIYPFITDDLCPAVEDFRPAHSDAIWYMLAKDEGDLLGMWIFVPQNGICWEVHTCLLPVGWGERGARAARELAGWVWQHTECRRIITNVPECNRLALRFAMRAGMETFGRNKQSFLKSGKVHDQIMLGLSRPEEGEQCQQQ